MLSRYLVARNVHASDGTGTWEFVTKVSHTLRSGRTFGGCFLRPQTHVISSRGDRQVRKELMAIEYPIPLKVSPQKAKIWVDQIPHENCRRGGNTCWSVDSDGAVSERDFSELTSEPQPA